MQQLVQGRAYNLPRMEATGKCNWHGLSLPGIEWDTHHVEYTWQGAQIMRRAYGRGHNSPGMKGDTNQVTLTLKGAQLM